MQRVKQDCMNEYKLWASDLHFDEATRTELLAIKDNENEIVERFVQNLSFGTGGLRAEIGAGTNRMNIYTVAHASEAFARYVDGLGDEAKKRGVAISYDSRIKSDEFALVTALVFATHGIKVYLSDILRPTPMLSFAVREFNCVGGVMITASHNPAKYNGYKAYGSDGGQMPPEAADVILAEMEKIKDFREVKWISEKEALDKGLLQYFGKDLDEKYDQTLLNLRINPEAVARHADLKIVYTPLHGAGNLPVQRILKLSGFENVLVVKEQEQPDGHFSTVKSPNPEERSALELAIKLAESNDASLLIATDPDSDRMGIVVRLHTGEYKVLTGNQIGLHLMDYILSAKKNRGTLEDKSFCATTIVSTKLARPVCDYYNVKLFETLTGFKYIAELIEKYDENGDMHFQFGFEESYGYLTGTDVRDKDAVVSAMLIAEMAAVAADENKTLADILDDFFKKYGYGREKTISITLEGLDGLKKISECMNQLRIDSSFSIDSTDIIARRDYDKAERYEYQTGVYSELDLPRSNVLLYELEGMDQICVRPSGTEPKLKIYFACYGENLDSVEDKLEKVSKEFENKIRSLLNG